MCYSNAAFFVQIVREETIFTQQIKRYAIIVSLAAGHTDSEIAAFLKVVRSCVFKIRSELKAAGGDVAAVAERKRHCQRSDCIRTPEFVNSVQAAIDENPGKLMRALTNELEVDKSTIRHVAQEDLHYKSYVMQRGQFMSDRSKVNCLTRAKRLLNKLKHPEKPGMIWFFSDEKNFVQDQKVNRKNDQWLCKRPDEVPTVIHTKFPASAMVLGVVSSEGDVMPPHFFTGGLRVNADAYTEMLDKVIKPWVTTIAHGKPYVFQQDSIPSHTARTTQEWMADNFYDNIIPNIWPPSSPDLNFLDYYVWGIVERDSNCHPHNTVEALVAVILDSMGKIPKTHFITPYSHFRRRIEAIIAADGEFIE